MAENCFSSKPIFIGGDGRSGTTLLSLILDSHSQLVVGPELHFSGPKNLGPYLLECCELLIAGDARAFGQGLKEAPEFKLGVQFAKRCHRFGVEFVELRELVTAQLAQTGGDVRSFADRCVLIDEIGEHRREATGAQRWGIKIMRDIGKVHLYHGLWPEAQFIHLIRDGRDVAASQMTEYGSWGYGDVRKAAKGWYGLIDQARIKGRSAEMLEVRYEDLVTDTELTTRKVAEFLRVDWEPALLQPHVTEHSLFENPYNHPSVESLREPINDSAIGRYRSDLTPRQVKLFNRIAGKYLKALGYCLDNGG